MAIEKKKDVFERNAERIASGDVEKASRTTLRWDVPLPGGKRASGEFTHESVRATPKDKR